MSSSYITLCLSLAGICSLGVCIAQLDLAVGQECGLYLGSCPTGSQCGGPTYAPYSTCGGDGTSCTSSSACEGGICTPQGTCATPIAVGKYCDPGAAFDLCSGGSTCASVTGVCGGAGAHCVNDDECANAACFDGFCRGEKEVEGTKRSDNRALIPTMLYRSTGRIPLHAKLGLRVWQLRQRWHLWW